MVWWKSGIRVILPAGMVVGCLASGFSQSSNPNQAPPVESAPPVPSAPPVGKASPAQPAPPAANAPAQSPSDRQIPPAATSAEPVTPATPSTEPAPATPPPEAVQIDATHPQGTPGQTAGEQTVRGQVAGQPVSRATRLRRAKRTKKVVARPLPTRPSDDSRPAVRVSGNGSAVAVDNTKVNQRDLNANELTADQAKSNRTDRETARLIRHEIYSDKSLSTYAHNIKIIARDGKVTLKGPVRTAVEKVAVETKAKEIAGATNVTSEISIKPDSD